MRWRTDDMTSCSGLNARVGLWACVWSALTTALGGWWLLDPAAYPYGVSDPHADMSLLYATTAGQAAVWLLTAGPIGIAIGAASSKPGRHTPAVIAGAALFAVGYGLAVPDLQLLILITYLATVVAPFALLVLVAAVLIRYPRYAAAVLGALTAALASSLILGFVDPRALEAIAAGITNAGVALGVRPYISAFFLVGGLLWAWTAVGAWRQRHGRCEWCGRPSGPWTAPDSAARWGRWVTIAAAAGPLPYALIRLTWLLPKDLRLAPTDLDAQPGLRLFGLLIGLVALAGSVLTMGLTARWGERFPRWAPRRSGRPVPVRPVVALAGTLAVVITVGGVSMIRQALFVGDADWVAVLAMPLIVWGPVLGAAVLAYYHRRRAACRRCDGAAGTSMASTVGDTRSDSGRRERSEDDGDRAE